MAILETLYRSTFKFIKENFELGQIETLLQQRG